MKIFSASQIRDWDQYTVQHEPIAPIDLMERAAAACCEWIAAHTRASDKFYVFCGPGNNGGDGLALARMLISQGRVVEIYILQHERFSNDFTTNLQRLRSISYPVTYLISETDFPILPPSAIVIDALYGYGLNRPLDSLASKLVKYINESRTAVIAIDMPSGLYADSTSKGNTIINAAYTLTFQTRKLSFLLPENAAYTGSVYIMEIGLHPGFYKDTESMYEITSPALLSSIFAPRKRFSHKGDFGNAALIAGSYGMMGAAVLSAKACLRSGVGKLTCHIPEIGYSIMQTAVPEAMCVTKSGESYHTQLLLEPVFDAYAIGPGMGQHQTGALVLETLLDLKPEKLVIDADALNILAQHPHLFSKIPPNTILTPHPKEFERLFGKAPDDFSRLLLAMDKAKALKSYIIIKGSYTFIATPGGKGYFNPTGNPGMATGGSGDILTGILLGLYAQDKDASQVVLGGVYLHGMAGDLAASQQTEEALIAGDIADHLPDAFRAIKKL